MTLDTIANITTPDPTIDRPVQDCEADPSFVHHTHEVTPEEVADLIGTGVVNLIVSPGKVTYRVEGIDREADTVALTTNLRRSSTRGGLLGAITVPLSGFATSTTIHEKPFSLLSTPQEQPDNS